MRSLPHRLLLLALIVTLAGCDVARGLVRAVLPVPTALPTNTPYPAPTPQPGAAVSVKVRVPVNTPAGSSLNLLMPDTVGGLANRTFIMTGAGNNLWTVDFTAPIGSLLRYRFQRLTGPQTAPEVQAGGAAIQYRTALVTGPTVLDDTVAAWSDTPFIGEAGRITGIVRDASSNQGLPGLVVSAAGQQTFTGFDGEYVLWNVPANAPLTVNAFAPDGSFRTGAATATVTARGAAGLDFALWAAKTVNVNFIVAPPRDTLQGAPVRLAGDTLQLGDTFSGGIVRPQREPVLKPRSDGRWEITLPLYEGLDLRYKYTLGSGSVNGELRADGSPNLRQFIVPADDLTIIQDQVTTWHSSVDPAVNFSVNIPASTPFSDQITIQFKFSDAWSDAVPMWQATQTNWIYTLYNPLNFNGQAEFRFCRNYQCGIADDAATFGPSPAGYRFTPTLFATSLQNNITNWQWWSDAPAVNTVIPPFSPNPSFEAGFELAPWNAADAPALSFALDTIKSDSANWVRIPILWDAPAANPPLISADFSRSPLRPDLLAAIKAARDRGLKVALYPQVRPAPNGPFAGSLNLYFDAGAKDNGWWDGWFREYARALAYVADVATFTGSDMLYVGDLSLARALPGGAGAPADAETRWRNILAAIHRDHFRGPLAFALDFTGQSPDFTAPPPPFLDAVDVIDIHFSAALTPTTNASLTELRTGAATLLDGQLLPLAIHFGKPILLTAAYPSSDGGAAACLGVAGGSCQPVSAAAPDQPNAGAFALDLGEQAAAYEALLNAIVERPWITGFYGYGYSVPVALRDKYYSPRAKPAESLLAAWYPRLK